MKINIYIEQHNIQSRRPNRQEYTNTNMEKHDTQHAMIQKVKKILKYNQKMWCILMVLSMHF